MTTTANIIPTAGSDGVPYATSVPLTNNEADLGDSVNAPHPIAIEYGQVIVAVVQLSIPTGVIFIQPNAYVIMQTDMGDAIWIDVAWAVWSQAMGNATFVLFGGGLGNGGGSFQQSRVAGAFPNPQSLSSNAMPIGGRIRFVGKAITTGGSSGLPGVSTAISATIKYKLMAPR
jgi:hypothetical protein